MLYLLFIASVFRTRVIYFDVICAVRKYCTAQRDRYDITTAETRVSGKTVLPMARSVIVLYVHTIVIAPYEVFLILISNI